MKDYNVDRIEVAIAEAKNTFDCVRIAREALINRKEGREQSIYLHTESIGGRDTGRYYLECRSAWWYRKGSSLFRYFGPRRHETIFITPIAHKADRNIANYTSLFLHE